MKNNYFGPVSLLLASLLLFSSLLEADSFILSYAQSNGTWQALFTGGRGPLARWGHSMTVIGDRAVMFGGQRTYSDFINLADNRLNDTWVLDLQRGIWSEVTSIAGTAPSARSEHCAVTDGTDLYLFGGANAKGTFDDFWIFKMSSFKWEKFTLSGFIRPAARFGSSCVFLNDYMLIYGGSTNIIFSQAWGAGVSLNDLWAFKPADLTVAPLVATGFVPPIQTSGTVCFYCAYLLLFGGFNDPSQINSQSASGLKSDAPFPTNQYLVYTLQDGKYQALAPRNRATDVLPTAVRGHTNVQSGWWSLLFGGLNSADVPLDNFFAYDSVANEWLALDPYVTASASGSRPGTRTGHSAIVWGESMVIFGGKSGTAVLSDLWAVSLAPERIYEKVYAVDSKSLIDITESERAQGISGAMATIQNLPMATVSSVVSAALLTIAVFG